MNHIAKVDASDQTNNSFLNLADPGGIDFGVADVLG